MEGPFEGETDARMVGITLGGKTPVGCGVTVGKFVGDNDGSRLGKRVGVGVPTCDTGDSEGWGLMEGASVGAFEGILDGCGLTVGVTDSAFDGLPVGWS